MQEGILEDIQRFFYQGEEMGCEDILGEHDIGHGSVIDLVVDHTAS